MAAQNRDDVCGIVLLAGAGRPVLDVIQEQMKPNLSEEAVVQMSAAMDQLKAGETVDPDSLPLVLRGLFHPSIQDFMRSSYTIDPAPLAAKLDLPILVVHLEEDLQVSAKDAELLHAAAQGSELVRINGVNHVLKPVEPGKKEANVASYSDAEMKIDPRVAEAIAEFVKRKR